MFTRMVNEWKASWSLQFRRREMAVGYLLILPVFLLYGVFTLWPIVDSFFMSFTNAALTNPITRWIGLENYAAVAGNPEFWQSFYNTTVFAIQVLPLNIAISLALALLVQRRFLGVGIFRTIFYAPVVTSMVGVAVVWLWIFNPSFGILNMVLQALHLPTQSWLVEPNWSLEVIVLLRVWKGVGANMVIFLAGLNSIPRELLEAADVDGASRFKRFWLVVWPLLRPTTLYVIVLGTISLFQAFSEMYVMTQGGPIGTSTTVVYYMFENAFQAYQLGYGSAIAFVLFIVIFILSLFNLIFVQRWMKIEY